MTVLLAGLPLAAVAAAAPESSQDAIEILRRVGARYGRPGGFHFAAHEATVTRSGSFERKNDQTLVTASDGKGRMRLEFDNSTISGIAVFDGEKSWLYLPSFGQYNVRYGDTLPDAGDGNVPIPDLRSQTSRYPARYKAIGERLNSAEVKGHEEISLGGEVKRCTIIEAAYDAPPGVSKGEIQRTFWIDPVTSLVLRERSLASSQPPNLDQRIVVTQDINFTIALAAQELPAELFEFEPPEGAVAVSQFGRGGTANKVATGTPAPDFTLSDLNGKGWKLSELRGKTVLLDFWATWCMPCRVDMPHIEALHREFKDRGLIVLGVNAEDSQQPASFLQEQGYTFPTLSDAGYAVAKQFQVQVIPTLIVIDKQGMISDFFLGSQTEATLREAVIRAGARESK
jgi:peroxiredoxin/outer membrane lipoprotein-sorting protein